MSSKLPSFIETSKCDYIWQWKDSNKWYNFESSISNEIEKGYQRNKKGKIQIKVSSYQIYDIFFETMVSNYII
jgi:hypothetical protein